ncbi:DEAD/DEAH box helicase [Alphaproteobacteria bacterium HT1-32]|nr:DEAD/DEAH box helicase [Alphaproteobacteria bacterium HT1-32]
MFDPVTAEFLRSAPALPGLDPDELPQLLTAQYAEFAARRLRMVEGGDESADDGTDTDWPLTRIADSYELIVSIQSEPDTRRAAAFVAGTAQQILAQEAVAADIKAVTPIMDRDGIDPAVAAAVLFLAAEQYADAHEAARNIRPEDRPQHYVCTLLAEDIRDLASGHFDSILERSERRPAAFVSAPSLEERSTIALFEALIVGIELFASEVLSVAAPEKAHGRFDNARAAFQRVVELSSRDHAGHVLEAERLLTSYPGPRHIASLLLAAYESTVGAAVTKMLPPGGANVDFWQKWLRHRASTAPFLWPNHREALGKGFQDTGKSAVLVLPTGAGKTTVSCVKIAGALARGKSVIFIAPTHALVDQLTEDLQQVFPEELEGSVVSSDFDRAFTAGSALESIEVMTPERCLALLSYAPEVFENVSLLVFDECHLLSPSSNLRRALDSMFCVLSFNSIVPNADFLFLSAMLRNGSEFAVWIEKLTGRECVFADPLWKPSRQARGVVLYERKTLEDAKKLALKIQRDEAAKKKKQPKGLLKPARDVLKCKPFALFGLQHNWLKDDSAFCTTVKISDSPVTLTGKLSPYGINLTPNANKVAAHIAATAARNGLKGIVFVNSKITAASTAREISEQLGDAPKATQDEQGRWEALECELGDLKHSLIPAPTVAVPHSAQMIRQERDLAERLYRRADGAQVIVATPTLAQGLNLPAHIAILAGDKRSDPEDGEREALEAHEILNAAARAGRAGHLANGIVLLVPEPILQFSKINEIESDVIEKLQSVLPEDDRCLTLSDPLQVILDRISSADLTDGDVEYALNRLGTSIAPENAETEAKTRFDVKNSFAGFLAERRNALEEFNAKVQGLNEVLAKRTDEADDTALGELARQSGAPISVLKTLKLKLMDDIGTLPNTIPGWASWVIAWLEKDDTARDAILTRDRRAIRGAAGLKKDGPLSAGAVKGLEPGIIAWLTGAPIRDIERQLGGDPEKNLICPQARELISQVIPLSFSFAAGLVSRTASEIEDIATGSATSIAVTECFATGIRRGFDTPNKLAFADIKRGFISRVHAHKAFAEAIEKPPEFENTANYQEVFDRVKTYL